MQVLRKETLSKVMWNFLLKISITSKIKNHPVLFLETRIQYIIKSSWMNCFESFFPENIIGLLLIVYESIINFKFIHGLNTRSSVFDVIFLNNNCIMKVFKKVLSNSNNIPALEMFANIMKNIQHEFSWPTEQKKYYKKTELFSTPYKNCQPPTVSQHFIT